MTADQLGPDDAGENTGNETQGAYEISDDDRTWGILVHAVAFVGFFFPFGNIIGPLIVWAIKKDESQFVDENGKQAVNFQISWTIWLIIAAFSMLILIGFILLPLVAIAWFVLVIVAIIRASNNTVYEYPLTLEIIS